MKNKLQAYKKPLWLSFVGALALYLGAMFYFDAQKSLGAMLQMGLGPWVVILGLSLLNYGFRFLRWQGYLQALQAPALAWGQHLRWYLTGFALTTTPGKAGEAIRSLYLKKAGVSYQQSLSAFFVERLLDLVVIGAISLLALTHFGEYAWWVMGLFGFFALAFPLLFGPLADKVVSLFQKKQWAAGLAEVFFHSRSLLAPVPLGKGMLWGLAAWGCEALGFWLLLGYLGASLPLFLAMGVYGLAVLVGALSFLPGGLGGTEAMMVLMLLALGLDEPTALAATLICRIATLWFAVVIGLLAMLQLEMGERNNG